MLPVYYLAFVVNHARTDYLKKTCLIDEYFDSFLACSLLFFSQLLTWIRPNFPTHEFTSSFSNRIYICLNKFK